MSRSRAASGPDASDDFDESSSKNAVPLRAGEKQAASSMTAEELNDYLNGLKTKDEAACSEEEGAVHIYKELAGTYTIEQSKNWKLELENLPKYNEYGNEYTYYIKETDPSSGYEVTYNGQDTGIQNGGNVEIVNELSQGSLEITKNVLYNRRQAVTDTEKALLNGSYTFEVKKNGIPITGSPFTITVTNGISNSILIPDLEPGEDYTIEETGSGSLTLDSTGGGTAVNDNVVTATVTAGKLEEAELLDTAKAEFANNCTAYEVVIIKVDTGSTNTRLGSARFDLYDEEAVEDGTIKDGMVPIKTNLISSSAEEDKGKVSLGVLTPGTYYLDETEAPPGYVKMDGLITITVSDNRVSLMQGSRMETGTISQEKTELTVMNSAGASLPHTGGPGTYIVYLTGIMLTGIAGAALLLRRRKKQPQSRHNRKVNTGI